MAKKWKKKADDEEEDFKLPEFDEKEYVEKELKETRILVVTVLASFVFAFVSLGIMLIANKECLAGVAVGLMGAVALFFIYPAAKIDITKFDGKKWAMNVLTYLGLWLAVWILISNPPVTDLTPPTIREVTGSSGHGWVPESQSQLTLSLANSTAVTLNATVTDNHKLDPTTVGCVISPMGSVTPMQSTTVHAIGSSKWQWSVEGITPGQYTVTIRAKDSSSNEKVLQFTLDLKS